MLRCGSRRYFAADVGIWIIYVDLQHLNSSLFHLLRSQQQFFVFKLQELPRHCLHLGKIAYIAIISKPCFLREKYTFWVNMSTLA